MTSSFILSEGYARGLREERRQEAVTVTAAAFSPCGEYLICASDSGRLAIWELAPYMNKGAWVEGRRYGNVTPGVQAYNLLRVDVYKWMSIN